MVSHKISLDKKRPTEREQLLQADEFLQKSSGVVSWLEENRRPVLLGLAAILLTAFGVVGIDRYLDYSAEKISREFTDILGVVDIPVGAPAEEASGKSQVKGDLPAFFETQTQKDEFFIKKMQEFMNRNKSAKNVGVAYLFLGNSYRSLGKYEEAIKNYELALKDKHLNPNYTFIILENMGYVYEEKGETDKAMEHFKKLSQGKFMQDAGLYHQARILAKQGKKEEAKELLNRVVKEFPESAFKHDSELRLNLFN